MRARDCKAVAIRTIVMSTNGYERAPNRVVQTRSPSGEHCSGHCFSSSSMWITAVSGQP